MGTNEEMTGKELNERLAISAIFYDTIDWFEQRRADLRDVKEQKDMADNSDDLNKEDYMAFALKVARDCAKEYFSYHSDDDEIFEDCEEEERITSEWLGVLRRTKKGGRCEDMRLVLCVCRGGFGKLLGDYWKRMYNNDKLCGRNSVEELIGYCGLWEHGKWKENIVFEITKFFCSQ